MDLGGRNVLLEVKYILLNLEEAIVLGKYKCPEVGRDLGHLKNSEDSVGGVASTRGSVVGEELGKVILHNTSDTT